MLQGASTFTYPDLQKPCLAVSVAFLFAYEVNWQSSSQDMRSDNFLKVQLCEITPNPLVPVVFGEETELPSPFPGVAFLYECLQISCSKKSCRVAVVTSSFSYSARIL